MRIFCYIPPILASGLLTCLPAGCVQFPDLDRAVSEQAKAAAFPPLAPIETLPVAGPDPAGPQIETGLAARNDALRRRADELRNTPL